MGEVKVEKLLRWLTTWKADELTAHTTTRFLTWGWVKLEEGGLAQHNPAHHPPAPILTSYTWAVMEVKVDAPDNSE